jgi:hypothetical protein
VIEVQTTHVVAEDVRDRERPLAARHLTAWAAGPSASGCRAGF